MAIALDGSSSQAGNGAPTNTSLSWSHTVTSNSNGILLVCAYTSTNQTPSSVTYNGSALTEITSSAVFLAQTGRMSFWYLLAPATGTHTISYSCSADYVAGFGVSYTGVSQSGIPNSAATATANSGASLTLTTTTVADNTWLVSFILNSDATTPTAGTNLTVRRSQAGSVGFVETGVGDSNAAQTPAGSKSQVWNTTSSAFWAGGIISLAPGSSAFTRTPSDSIMNGASRSTTVARLWTTSRSLSDSISNGASRLAVVGKGYARLLSDSLMNAASRFATLASVLTPVVHFVANLSDSIMNGASRLTSLSARFITLARKSSTVVLSYFNKESSPTDYD